MALAVKKISQVMAHISIGFVIMFALTGSLVFSGLALLAEPVINVLLLPLHERAWMAIRANCGSRRALAIAGEKLSQTGMHTVVSFGAIYWATGSMTFGGVAAILEPICNVLLMPVHDRFWDKLFHAEEQGGLAGA
jgi:uncharacterized membrane protein